MKNPWLLIPADDYEGHMSSDNVLQLQSLNHLFKKTIDKIKPESLCVLGCTTGNGFEHINKSVTKRVVGIDINEVYLNILKKRFRKKVDGLELVCGDLSDVELSPNTFDLIYGALIFEYVDIEKILAKIRLWLKTKGILAVVLQMQTKKSNSVSDTKFNSLKKLNSIFNIVNVDEFRNYARKFDLCETYSSEYDLKTGKKFYVGFYKKEVVPKSAVGK